MLDDLVRAMVADVDPRTPPEGGVDQQLWRHVSDAGLAALLVPESAGGSGASFRDLAAVLRRMGSAAAAVPIAEANLAASVLAGSGHGVPEGTLTLTITGSSFGRSEVPGRLEAVPYARAADHVVWVRGAEDGRGRIHVIPTSTVEVEHGANLADEPRDHLTLIDEPEQVGTIASVWGLQIQAAACRALLIAGALEHVRDLTVAYAHEREQFGRPLSRFQAVQQLMVETIVVSQTARVLTDEMAEALAETDDPTVAAPLVAAARATVGRSATVATRCAHQVHGAIGFTVEHPLHASTRRLMAWRDEDGTQAAWSRWLGRHIRTPGGSGAAWRLITAGLGDRTAIGVGTVAS